MPKGIFVTEPALTSFLGLVIYPMSGNNAAVKTDYTDPKNEISCAIGNIHTCYE